MANEKSEWGEAGQPSEGGVVTNEDRKPLRPSQKPDDEQGHAPDTRDRQPRPASRPGSNSAGTDRGSGER